jgi:alginate O-acetyltransferase complex protein AlgI
MAASQTTTPSLVTVDDVRTAFATPDVRSFTMLVIPLGLLLFLFKAYRLEQPSFFTLSCLVFGGFAVSYWLPLRWKEGFLILLSLAGAFVLLGPLVAAMLIVSGLAIFAIARSALDFKWKVLLLLGLLAALAWGRTLEISSVPDEFWPVFGAIFMFRTIIYMYEVRYATSPMKLRDYLSYFFLLPNYYFLLFPVVDYQTFRKSWFKRDINVVAQQGVLWIFRGTTHLLIYRVIYQSQASLIPGKLPVAAVVFLKIVSSYLLYLRVSGQFHIIVGMLLLFGYDLPETHHRYFLASGINDLWRRINIYWKDFMVKIFYFPAYFKLRRKGDIRAQILATLLVFFGTWFLHIYQYFWLRGGTHVSLNDALFWSILCAFVCWEVLAGGSRRKRLPGTGWKASLSRGARVAGTFALMSLLWSMWSANSLTEWLQFLRTGNI